MSLNAQIIEPVTGKIDPELSARLEVDEHGLLFGHTAISSEQFPLLFRLKDYYADTDFKTAELESLISELERAASLFGPDSRVCRFLGPFHLLCCLAFLRKKDVALYAD
jgi:hypothetical protein